MANRTISVSVVIPVYNCETTIKKTIDSVLAQDNLDFEVIIVDDGSTDRSAEIITKYEDARIRYFYQENSGISSALNYGISQSNAEFIARIDGDDVALPNRLKVQYEILKRNIRVCLVGTAVDYINSQGVIIGRTFPYIFPFSASNILLQQNLYAHPSVMFRKDIFLKSGGYPNELSGICEDYYLWTRMIKFGKMINLSESLTQYRISEGQITDWVPSKEYYRLIRKIISCDVIDSRLVSKLKETKENDKQANLINSKSIKFKREQVIKNNLFNRIYSYLIKYKVSK
ncbi:TPA: glycosyltransferase family 2 protein, partial [Enterobacter hormaechei]|nr:glycosyltransferase family 2 protein [Enterobacter hormaechei]